MTEPVIQVEDVSKRFRLRGMGTRSLKSATLDVVVPGRAKRREFWALRDVSFAVGRGETLGIIGANGAGKSTLLALLARTKQPTAGRVRIDGTVASLLELGAGFHPDLTGRENVFLSGAVMGLSRRTMRERFDAIVAFSGIEPFIDQPVKHYSSGMYVRLGFAVAVEVDPDILLIDEVLAVGDVAFQRKCIEKMDEFRQSGKTMLIISHDLHTIQSVSDRILLLDGGRVQGLGDPSAVIGSYRTAMRSQQTSAVGREWGSGEVTLTGVDFLNAAGDATDRFSYGETLTARVHFESPQRIEDPVFGFSISGGRGAGLYGNNTQLEGHRIAAIEGRGTVTLSLGPLTLAPGNYLFSFSVHSSDHRVNYHRIDNGFAIAIEGDRAFEGVYMPVRWEGP